MVSTKKHTDEMLDRYKKDGENYVLFEDLENNISITLKNYDYNEYDELKDYVMYINQKEVIC